MTERTRWRSLHDQLVIENEALKKERDEAIAHAADLEVEIKGRDNCIDELKRAVERAKLEGAHALSGALLTEEGR
jgi:hypothetical protein